MTQRRGRRALHILGRLGAQETSRAVKSRWTQRRGEHAEVSADRQRAVAIRQALEQLGPLYIKIGQILTTRPDFVPDYVREELALLTDQATVHPFASFAEVLEEELGADWHASFNSFETDEPLGAASLAQVYRTTRRDGTPCVVKIQRPGSIEAVLGDMQVLRRVAKVIGRGAPRFNEVIDISAMFDVVFRAMADELDFTREADNMKDARKAARDYKTIKIPKPILATPRVLIQTLADGQSANRLKGDELSTKQRKKVAKELMAYVFKSYFTDRAFHADPHPGNFLISPNGKAHIIDWGMVGRLDRSTSTAVLGAMVSIAYNDGPALARSWMQLGTPLPWSDVGGFISDISRFVPHVTDASLEKLNFGVALTSVLTFSTRRGIQTSPNVSMIGKSIANLEGTVRYIYPRMKMADIIRDFTQSILTGLVHESISPEQLALHAITAIQGISQNYPGDISESEGNQRTPHGPGATSAHRAQSDPTERHPYQQTVHGRACRRMQPGPVRCSSS
ncbi:ATP/GTP-binding protein [Streptomyces longispororuber]|uniref:ATP/GTP-binding protein n=1 Tax=Streptomyces longispororuber TaxID=68230 RepID=A0A918ZBS6_9ACTN|nr:AarF/UbiB family protein [Streptomyces longispororuber]GHE43756.1 ATP/GTP-binding protein [Streptomyces longispororuber]